MGVALNQFASIYISSGTAAVNVVYAYPFYVNQPYRVRNLWWLNGATAAGTATIGIYDTSGKLLVGGAATLVSGISTAQVVAVDYTLPIGGYYAAWSTDSATTTTPYMTINTAGRTDFAGLAQYVPGTSTVPLPSSITLAPYTQNRIPLYGLSRDSSL